MQNFDAQGALGRGSARSFPTLPDPPENAHQPRPIALTGSSTAGNPQEKPATLTSTATATAQAFTS